MLRVFVKQTIRKLSTNASAGKCNRLEGKVAIVTASTRGIGLAIARRFAQEGAKVMICSRKEPNVKKAVEELKSEGLQVSSVVCHVGDSDHRKNLLEKTKEEFGGLDILVSNAGVNPVNPDPKPLFDTTEQLWDKIFDVNVKSSFLLMQESLPLLRKSKSPSIILMSSIAAYNSIHLLGAYAVSKTCLVGLNYVAAASLASEGIRVNTIAPGIIKTKFSQILYEGKRDTFLSIIPMQRFGETNDIAGIAAFLASNDAAYITGETIVAAGGMKSRL
ncbi:dehydrogenase/reductase SDR family member 4-like [Hylaeus volcanicus]|uniref:dehydrogenase/reductase SDR family member 4-like n=1 Tax=Hylaeus volcanicus TaxID=313075 RepID=UPI0023B86493|nr:dehydrogenase/reductase SDR family member 4-like [Hylaeus volcanicus]